MEIRKNSGVYQLNGIGNLLLRIVLELVLVLYNTNSNTILNTYEEEKLDTVRHSCLGDRIQLANDSKSEASTKSCKVLCQDQSLQPTETADGFSPWLQDDLTIDELRIIGDAWFQKGWHLKKVSRIT